MDMTERIHCINLTNYNLTNGLLYNKSTECVGCFFYQNCLPNNECLEGSTGLTCEVCDTEKNYFLFGNSCIKCEHIPWSAVAFGVFILLIVASIIHKGFTAQLITKLKIIIHFLQLLLLTIHIKIQWPAKLMWFVSMLGFGSFTASTVKLRCLLPGGMHGYFIEWGTASGIPVFIIILGLIIDQRRRNKLVSLEKAKFDVEQTVKEIITIRRFLFLVAVVYFMPITLSVIHSFSCYSTFGEGMVFRLSRRDVFLYDNNQTCDDFVFQVIHLLLIFPMMIYTVVLPLFLILFTLRQRKWDLLDSKETFYGFAYESYTRRLCFWEALPMLRKLLGIFLTDTVLTHPFYQSIGHLCLTGFYLLLVILFRPYRNFYWTNRFMNNHVILDVVCNVGIAVLQGGSLLLVFDVYDGFIDYIIIITLCLVIVYWIICIFTSQFEKQTHVVVEITRSDASMSQDTSEGDSVRNIQLHQVASKKSVSFTGKKNKVANKPDTSKITRSDASMSQDTESETSEGDSVENIQLHQVASKKSISSTEKNTFDF